MAQASGSLARRLGVYPLTPERWDDFVALFGPRGACGGCWCMTPRLTRGDYEKRKGAGNRRAMKRLVGGGRPTGLLGYLDGEAVAWCAVAPREDYSSLSRSRILRPVDDRPVWSIVCLFVSRAHRERGVSVAMLRAAARHARQCGARIVEAYPVEPRKDRIPPVFAYQGIASAYARAGFREVARRSPTRPIMRKQVR